MEILYCAIYENNKTVAEYSTLPNENWTSLKHNVKRIPQNISMHTFMSRLYSCHYTNENGIIFMCVSNNALGRNEALEFLTEIRRKFTDKSEINSKEIIEQHVIEFNRRGQYMTINDDNNQHETDIESAAERLRLLGNEADNLANRGRCGVFRNHKFYALLFIIVAVLAIIYALIAGVCGGFSFSSCLQVE